MKIVIVSPLEFVAIAEKTTAVEKLLSMLANDGIFHDGVMYRLTERRPDDPTDAAERMEAVQLVNHKPSDVVS